jgi:hypothetical protein
MSATHILCGHSQNDADTPFGRVKVNSNKESQESAV